MSHPTQSPGATPPTPAGPAPAGAPVAAPDVFRQIAELTEAVNRLVQAQPQQHAAQRAGSPSNAQDPSADIGGDLQGGEPLVAAVDHARLSPLQQITLGLRGVTPVGLTHPIVERSRATSRRDDTDERAPQGAD